MEQTKANEVRHIPAYAPPSRFNLIGRILHACSGAATRRARACARLNYFVSLAPTLKAPKWLRFRSPTQYDHGMEVALDKFKHSYAECRSEAQQAGMLAALSDHALRELEKGRHAGGLVFSADDVKPLLAVGIKVKLSSSLENIQLDEAIMREWTKRQSEVAGS